MKNVILEMLNNELTRLDLGYLLNESMLDTLVLDVTRAVDDKLTALINQHKNEQDLKLNSVEKEELRKHLLGYYLEKDPPMNKIPHFVVNQEDLNKAYSLIEEGFYRNKNIMIESLVARIKKTILNHNDNHTVEYINYLKNLQANKVQLQILSVDSSNNLSSNNIAEIIKSNYDSLSNYHHFAVIFTNEDSKVDWKKLTDVAIFMENFKTEFHFNVFNDKNRQRRTDELKSFLKSHDLLNYSSQFDSLIENFYNGVSYGFQFKDLFITSDGKHQILIMQKVELDEKPKKCPACLEESVRGNSYPRILYKSFECTNPSCPSRSKIGRGKRYDLLAAKRQAYLERDNYYDRIDHSLYFEMRKDILLKSEGLIENLISLYTWADDSVLLINTIYVKNSFNGRNILYSEYRDFDNDDLISDLAIHKLFSTIANNITFSTDSSNYKSERIANSLVINGNSSEILPNLKSEFKSLKVTCAVTSPPYYNAREYSQWPNLITYLIDMMISAKAVFTSLSDKGTYIYNIGDVVEQDNVYIISNMSKRRQMLGFYSVFVFELAKFKTISNIIWDKGEVQSKRNSTSNLFPGYVNPVNSYEHCFVFSKDREADITPTRIERINAVMKINSKGENTLGHTAPFPIGIPELILPYVDKQEKVLDPFLGSGTTCIALMKHGIGSVGFELNNEYFKLACDRISKTVFKEWFDQD